jgi:hypothetical protein
MEEVMRYFFFRAKIEERALTHTAGEGRAGEADWRRIDEAFMRAVHVAEKVARYRHAQFSAIKLAGDIKATKYDDATLDELLAKLNAELRKLGPLIELDSTREPHGVEARSPVTMEGSQPGWPKLRVE